jgi:Glycosyltransferase family 87
MSRGLGGRGLAWLGVGLLVARVALLLFGLHTLPASSAGFGLGNDARRFHDIATAPGTPYRDAQVEVPPLAVGAIELLDGGTSVQLARRLAIAMLACDVAIAVVLWRGWNREVAAAYWVMGTPLAFFIYLRLDLLTVLLAVGAIALARRRSAGAEVAGGAAIAASVFTKLWPVVLLPLLWIDRARRAAIVAGGAIVVGTIAWIAWVGTQGPIQVLTFRHATGWEIESEIGFVVWRVTGDVPVRSGGALRVGHVPGVVRLLLIVGTALVILWGWWRCRARPDLAEGLGATVAVAALIVGSTVLSHQYVAWLLPWVAIAAFRPARLLTAIAAVGAAATMLYTATDVPHALGIQLWMLGVRNAAIVGVLATAALELSRSAHRRSDGGSLP